MGAIFLHQLRDNLQSLRFQISLVILLLFFGANGVIYTMKTGNLADEVTRITRLNEERYGRVETTADAASTSYKIRCAEVGTEFMAEAGSDWFRYAMYVHPGVRRDPRLRQLAHHQPLDAPLRGRGLGRHRALRALLPVRRPGLQRRLRTSARTAPCCWC